MPSPSNPSLTRARCAVIFAWVKPGGGPGGAAAQQCWGEVMSLLPAVRARPGPHFSNEPHTGMPTETV